MRWGGAFQVWACPQLLNEKTHVFLYMLISEHLHKAFWQAEKAILELYFIPHGCYFSNEVLPGLELGLKKAQGGVQIYLCPPALWSPTSPLLFYHHLSSGPVPTAAGSIKVEMCQGCTEIWIKTASLAFFLASHIRIQTIVEQTHTEGRVTFSQVPLSLLLAETNARSVCLMLAVCLPRSCQELFGLSCLPEVAVCSAGQDTLIFNTSRVLNILLALHKYELKCLHNIDMWSSELKAR